MTKTILFIFFIFLLRANAASQADSTALKVDAYILEKMQQYQIPGIAISVLKNNVVIKETTFGVSNLDHEVPVTNKTVFPIASMDKQITATCIMMLYEQNKIKLTNTIGLYLDSVPTSWSQIQVRHLLSHTSGLPDEVAENFSDRSLIYYTTEEILGNIKRQKLQFKPGDKWLYSDADFFCCS